MRRFLWATRKSSINVLDRFAAGIFSSLWRFKLTGVTSCWHFHHQRPWNIPLGITGGALIYIIRNHFWDRVYRLLIRRNPCSSNAKSYTCTDDNLYIITFTYHWYVLIVSNFSKLTDMISISLEKFIKIFKVDQRSHLKVDALRARSSKEQKQQSGAASSARSCVTCFTSGRRRMTWTRCCRRWGND